MLCQVLNPVQLAWHLILFCACSASEKLGICHVRRTVSRNRRIFVTEMGVSKAIYVAYSIYLLLTQFSFCIPDSLF